MGGTDDNNGWTALTPAFSGTDAPNTVESGGTQLDMSGISTIRYIAIRQPAAQWLQISEVDIQYVNPATLSISNNNLENVNVYAKDQVLSISGLEVGKSSVSLFNSLGQNVLNKSVEANANIVLPNLQTGVYIVKIQNENGSFTQKLIIE